MRIEDIYYVFMKVGNIEIGDETVYLNSDYEFTNDIREALKAVNRTTALDVKRNYEETKNHNYESDLKIVPLKVTHEW